MFSCFDKSPKVQDITPKMFNSTHELPELNKGVMRIYSMRFCPFSQRVEAVLGHKGVKFETVNIDLKDKPAWMKDLNESLEVPILQQDDKILTESVVCMEYLDGLYTKNPLLPSDPKARSVARKLILDCSKVYNSYFALMGAKGDPEKLQAAKDGIKEACKHYETILKEMGTPFFGGKSVGMVDYTIYPWFERFPLYLNTDLPPPMQADLMPADEFPLLTAWREKMYETPGIKVARQTLENHTGFIKGIVFEGKFNYDFGLE